MPPREDPIGRALAVGAYLLRQRRDRERSTAERAAVQDSVAPGAWLVDILGLLAVRVTAADVSDRDGAMALRRRLGGSNNTAHRSSTTARPN